MLVSHQGTGRSERIGRYEVLRKIATGGMAELFLARQVGMEGFEKVVAIKRILAHLAYDEEFINMFRDEARLVAKLSHPNIVQIYDLAKSEDTYFIAMEYIPGRNLSSVAKKCRAKGVVFPPEYVARCVAQACEGLYYAHTRKDLDGSPLEIVHRDVSPQNIILAFSGSVKLVDFGIAKAATKIAHTRAGVLKGKYAYMSPEQIRGDSIDARSDVFAVGIVLYELLCGRRPFEKDNSIQTLKAIVQDPHLDCRRLNPNIPDALAEIIDRALVKDPENRFQTAQEAQIALEDFVTTSGTRCNNIAISRWVTDLFAEELSKERGGTMMFPGLGEVILPEPDREVPPSDRSPAPVHETPDLDHEGYGSPAAPVPRAPIPAPSTLSRAAFGQEMHDSDVLLDASSDVERSGGGWENDRTVLSDDARGSTNQELRDASNDLFDEETHFAEARERTYDPSGPTLAPPSGRYRPAVADPTVDMGPARDPWNEPTVGPDAIGLIEAEREERKERKSGTTLGVAPVSSTDRQAEPALGPASVTAGLLQATGASERRSEATKDVHWRDLTDFDARRPFDSEGETWSLENEPDEAPIVEDALPQVDSGEGDGLAELGWDAPVTGQQPLNADDFLPPRSFSDDATVAQGSDEDREFAPELDGPIIVPDLGANRRVPPIAGNDARDLDDRTVRGDEARVVNVPQMPEARGGSSPGLAPEPASDWSFEIPADDSGVGDVAPDSRPFFLDPPTDSGASLGPTGARQPAPVAFGSRDEEEVTTRGAELAADSRREPMLLDDEDEPLRDEREPIVEVEDDEPGGADEALGDVWSGRRDRASPGRAGVGRGRGPDEDDADSAIASEPGAPLSMPGEVVLAAGRIGSTNVPPASLSLSQVLSSPPPRTKPAFLTNDEETRSERGAAADAAATEPPVVEVASAPPVRVGRVHGRQIREVVRDMAGPLREPQASAQPPVRSMDPPAMVRDVSGSAQVDAVATAPSSISTASPFRTLALAALSVLALTAIAYGLLTLVWPELVRRPTPSLRITTTPAGATVIIDGRRQTGLTPLNVTGLSPGIKHELRIELDGHEPYTMEFSLPPGRRSNLSVPLRAPSPAREDIRGGDDLLIVPLEH